MKIKVIAGGKDADGRTYYVVVRGGVALTGGYARRSAADCAAADAEAARLRMTMQAATSEPEDGPPTHGCSYGHTVPCTCPPDEDEEKG